MDDWVPEPVGNIDDAPMEFELSEGLMEELLGTEDGDAEDSDEPVPDADEEVDDEPVVTPKKKNMTTEERLKITREDNAVLKGERQRQARQTTLPDAHKRKTQTRKLTATFRISSEANDAYQHIVGEAIKKGGSIYAADVLVEKALMDEWAKISAMQVRPRQGLTPPKVSKVSKATVVKIKQCTECGTTDPARFYPYYNNICKDCHLAKQKERREQGKAEKAQKLHLQGRFTGAEVAEACAEEIKAAGPKGIFQSDLRHRVGIDRWLCKMAVQSLMEDGLIVHAGERTANGSPRLVWKSFPNEKERLPPSQKHPSSRTEQEKGNGGSGLSDSGSKPSKSLSLSSSHQRRPSKHWYR